ncbi:HD domain-containing phosphohydrolase [Elusimicrobiota bacterium]
MSDKEKSKEQFLEKISKIKSVQTKLQESEERLRELIESVPVGICISDPQGQIFEINDTLVKIFGYGSKLEFIKNPAAKYYLNKKDREQYLKELEEKGCVKDYEVQFVRKDGKVFWGLENSFAKETKYGVLFYSTLMDITVRKKAEEELKNSQQKYSSIVEKGNDGIVIIQDYLLKYANSVMEKFTGFSNEESIGKPFTEFISQPYRKILIDNYDKRMKGEIGNQKYEIEILSKEGHTIPAEINASTIEYEGKPANMAIIRDITERKKAMESLKRATFETMEALARMVEMNDPYTAGHSMKVAGYSMEISNGLALDEEQKKVMYIASVLHDIGKVGVPGNVLNKPTKLTHAERLMLEHHPVIGAKTIANISSFKEAVKIILHHHERWDGKGYPDRLKGENIPLLSRILAVADSFEAMISERPYHAPMSGAKAFAELKKGAGTQWDPKVVEIFLNIKKKSKSED